MKEFYSKRNILCIDLKSFFASVECAEKKLDPFTTPLVVADKSKGNGSITLAVTPYLKKLGLSSRGRLYEIPYNLRKEIIYAKPRMKLYLEKSKEVISVYLEFVSEEDMHIYSIDEVFLDVTDYLKMYNLTDYDLALKIMKRIKEKTKISATCGIGPNLFLAKIALDIESKHNVDCIAKWTYQDVKTKLWNITPLSKMWGIGKRYEKKLNNLGIQKVGDINKYSIDFFKKRFGIMGEELWYHANGIDLSNIKAEKFKPKSKSYGVSQILYRDYTPEEVVIIIREMCETLCKRLREKKKVCGLISFGIGYSKTVGKSFYHSRTLKELTDNANIAFEEAKNIFENYCEELPIRKVSLSFGKINDKSFKQLNIFDSEKFEENNEMNEIIDKISSKYGANSILNASALTKSSTIIERNSKLGGHNKE